MKQKRKFRKNLNKENNINTYQTFLSNKINYETQQYSYHSQRNSLNIFYEILGQKKQQKVIFLTMSSNCYKSDLNSKPLEKKRLLKLPVLNGGKVYKKSDNLFKRHDIVKDRLQKIQEQEIAKLNIQVSKKGFHKSNLTFDAQNISKFCENNSFRNSYVKDKQQFGTLTTTERKIYKKFTDRNSQNLQLQEQMKQIELIRKKNQLFALKLKRKYQDQRIKSNTIVSQALNNLFNQRESLLNDQERQDFLDN